MPKMGDLFHEAEEAVFSHIPHHAQPAASPQETRMTKLADARAAIDHAAQQLAAVPQNALADAIADEGAGLSFGPPEISLVLAVIHGIEHGPGAQALTMTPQVSFSATPVPATQVQPQQTA